MLGGYIYSNPEAFDSIGPPVTLPPGLALPGWSEPFCGGKLEGLVFVWESASPQ